MLIKSSLRGQTSPMCRININTVENDFRLVLSGDFTEKMNAKMSIE